MEYIVYILTKYLEFIRKEGTPEKNEEQDNLDMIITHFRSVNLTGDYTIERLPIQGIYANKSSFVMKGYSLAYNGDDPNKGISVAQLHNMNLTSGYKSTIESNGDYTINVFFLNKCINLIKESSIEADGIRKILVNLKLVTTHVIRELYPSFDERYANVAGGVVAVAIARRIGLPVTPSILSEAYHCTTALAEAIIDRYDVKEKKFVDTAWMF